MSRIFTLDSPLGERLKFRRLSGDEELGKLFEFRIEALADSHSLSLHALLGQSVTVRIEAKQGATRYLNGLVARAALAGRDAERHYCYELVVRPWLWLATRRADCRIFQRRSVPEIVQETLAPYGFPIESRLSDQYAPREYCVQYNETDADFVSRLIEQEGIYYYFEHANGRHTLVLCDAMTSHRALPGYATIPYIGQDRAAIADEEHIDSWVPVKEINPGRHEASDYDFTKPRADLSMRRADPRGHDHDGLAVYEWPGGYRDDVHGERCNRVRLEELQSEHERAAGHTDVRGTAPGYLFTLKNCPRDDQNREYLIVRCWYRFEENAYASHDGDEVRHDTQLVAQPASLPYRSRRTTPRPRTSGPQTAVVTGPQGEEIWTDQYGRVKLQFHWDRYARGDENTSCWVRVSTPWAGGGFGGVQVPRVGDEVIVDFLNGDPDHPIVTGRVYNADRMPPWGLPASATQSGILSRSTPGGSSAHANALRFEDKKGAEQFWMHAERNLDLEAEQDHTASIGRDRTQTIGRNETVNVQNDRAKQIGSNETVSVGQHRTAQVGGNESLAVGGDRSSEIGQNETVSVGANRIVNVAGNHTETVAVAKAETIGAGKAVTIGGLYQTTVAGAMNTSVGLAHVDEVGLARTTAIGLDHSTSVGGSQSFSVVHDHTVDAGDQVQIVAGQKISIVCGKSSITMDSGGNVIIQGVDVKAVGSSSHSIMASTVSASASGEHTIEGALLKLNP